MRKASSPNIYMTSIPPYSDIIHLSLTRNIVNGLSMSRWDFVVRVNRDHKMETHQWASLE